MASIVYKSLSSLSPVELKYSYNKEEELQRSIKTFNNGLTFYEVEGLANYRDIAINKDSCFVLTSAINLNTVFQDTQSLSLGTIPGTIQFAQRIAEGVPPIYFAKYNSSNNTFQQAFNSATTFYVQPIEGLNNVVELYVNNQYVQIDEFYPYTVRISDRSDDPDSPTRQRFEIVFQNNLITFKVLTNSGYRYLTFNEDNVLRATGLMLNESILNDYVFSCVPVTDDELNYGFKPSNNWVTYYFDIESGVDNKNLTVNKNIQPLPTNLLIDFPVEVAAKNTVTNINVANLKTSITPSGGPAPVNNAYTKTPATTNN